MTAMDAALAQALKNTRTAIALLMLLVQAADMREQNRILARSDSGLPLARLPGVITAAADLQSLGQLGNRELGAHLLDQGIPFGCGPSERMPRAFFKISRWRRRCSFSWRSSRTSFSRSAAEMFWPSRWTEPALCRYLAFQVRTLSRVMPSSLASWFMLMLPVRSSSMACCLKASE